MGVDAESAAAGGLRPGVAGPGDAAPAGAEDVAGETLGRWGVGAQVPVRGGPAGDLGAFLGRHARAGRDEAVAAAHGRADGSEDGVVGGKQVGFQLPVPGFPLPVASTRFPVAGRGGIDASARRGCVTEDGLSLRTSERPAQRRGPRR